MAKKDEAKQMKPKTHRVVASIKRETKGLDHYMDSMLETNDTVLKSIGGNYKIYDEILRDGQVKACFQQRRLAVVSSELMIEPASESAEDKACAKALAEEVELLKFDNLTDKMLYDQFYGYSVAELIWNVRGTRYGWEAIKVRNRSRFKFDRDCKLILPPKHGLGKNIKCDPPYFWHTSVGATHDDAPYGLGLAHYLYWPVIFKRGGVKFWMKFIERFAQPTLLGKYQNGTTEEDIDNLLGSMKAAASETGTILPDHMTLELLEATRSGSADQAKLIEIMDKEISKIILGQTMTTDDGSSHSQSKVHFDVRQDIIDSDARLQCESFQDGPATWFTEFNFPNAGVPKISRKTEKEKTPEERVKTDVEKTKLGYRPTQEYMDTHYGEGWVPIDTKTEEPKEDKEANFSEPTTSPFPDQQQLDDVLNSLSDTDLNDTMAPLIEQVLDFAEKHGPEETLKRMTELLPMMDIDDLAMAFGQMQFAAHTIGRINA